MKQIKKDLQGVLKSLKLATVQTEKLMKKMDKLDKPAVSMKSRVKTLQKPTKISDSDAVLAIIKRSKKGVEGAVLRKKTGFEGRKIRDIVYRLKKGGKIKTVNGVYLKA